MGLKLTHSPVQNVARLKIFGLRLVLMVSLQSSHPTSTSSRRHQARYCFRARFARWLGALPLEIRSVSPTRVLPQRACRVTHRTDSFYQGDVRSTPRRITSRIHFERHRPIVQDQAPTGSLFPAILSRWGIIRRRRGKYGCQTHEN